MPSQRLSLTVQIASFIITIVCSWVLVSLVAVHGNPFPSSDEWTMIDQAVNGLGNDGVALLFGPHADHRIPLPKLYHIILLRLSNFDFRITQATNAVLLILASLGILKALARSRNRAVFGDLSIPLVLLSPGFGATFWGFDIQFLSSTLLLIAFSLSAMIGSRDALPSAGVVGAFCLLLLPACGLNGVIPAIPAALALLWAATRLQPQLGSRHLRMVRLLCVVTIAACGLTFIGWKPSGATTMDAAEIGPRISELAVRFITLLAPNPMATPPPLRTLQPLGCAALVGGALVLLGARLRKSLITHGTVALADVGMASTLGAGLLLMLSIVVSRSSYWVPGLELHYGFLSVVLIVVAWAAISLHGPKLIVASVGTLLVAWALWSYVANLQWRTSWSETRDREIVGVYGDLARAADVDEFVQAHIAEFYYQDSAHVRQQVAQAIRLLRDRHIEPYAHLRD